MFCLLMLQGVGVFSARWVFKFDHSLVDSLFVSTRLINWKISLFIIMSTILVVIPLSISILLSIGASSMYFYIVERFFCFDFSYRWQIPSKCLRSARNPKLCTRHFVPLWPLIYSRASVPGALRYLHNLPIPRYRTRYHCSWITIRLWCNQ